MHCTGARAGTVEEGSMTSTLRAGARAPGVGNFHSCGCWTLLLTILSVLLGTLASVAEPNIEQQIKAGLVPPTLVKGESPQLMPLSARMEALHVPAVSIAVIHDGKLSWAGGFGTMSQGGPPVTVDTPFQAGSISKAVTAAAVMTLVQARKLDLDVDVNQYLKTWKVPP